MTLIPFTVDGKKFAVEIQSVLGAGLLSKIYFVPQSRPPAAGILLRQGGLFPVWNSGLFAGKNSALIKDMKQYLEVTVQGKNIILPAENIGSALEGDSLWKEQNFYGLRIFHRL